MIHLVIQEPDAKTQSRGTAQAVFALCARRFELFRDVHSADSEEAVIIGKYFAN